MPRPVRRARVLPSRGPMDSRELARSLEAERKVLEPLLPDMDPGDLLLILEDLKVIQARTGAASPIPGGKKDSPAK